MTMAIQMAEAMTRISSMQRGMPGTESKKLPSAATTMAPGKQRGKPREQRGKSHATMTEAIVMVAIVMVAIAIVLIPMLLIDLINPLLEGGSLVM